MVKVVPFKAYRPPSDIAASVASPPYDVISSEEARKLADGSEHSFLRVRACFFTEDRQEASRKIAYF